jgi:hypothetical protein
MTITGGSKIFLGADRAGRADTGGEEANNPQPKILQYLRNNPSIKMFNLYV